MEVMCEKILPRRPVNIGNVARPHTAVQLVVQRHAGYEEIPTSSEVFLHEQVGPALEWSGRKATEGY